MPINFAKLSQNFHETQKILSETHQEILQKLSGKDVRNTKYKIFRKWTLLKFGLKEPEILNQHQH